MLGTGAISARTTTATSLPTPRTYILGIESVVSANHISGTLDALAGESTTDDVTGMNPKPLKSVLYGIVLHRSYSYLAGKRIA